MRNKNGIPIVARKSKHSQQEQRKIDLSKLDFQEFAKFRRYEFGIPVTIVVPAFSPLLKTLPEDGWKCVAVTRGEIA